MMNRWTGALVVSAALAPAAWADSGAYSQGVPECPAVNPMARAAAHTLMAVARELEGEAAIEAASASIYELSPDGLQIQIMDGIAGVTNEARAELAFAQMDPDVAAFLVAGLETCGTPAQSAGYPRLSERLIAAFDGAGAVPWCGASLIKVSAVDAPPLVTMEEGCSPFYGPTQWNDYFIVSARSQVVDGRLVQEVMVDPATYTTTSAQYDGEGLIGPESNPHEYVDGSAYAVFAHRFEWVKRRNPATMLWEMGRFNTAVVQFGVTKYLYVRQYNL